MKIIVGIAVVVFTTYCGWFLSRRYRRRKQFFKDMQEFNLSFLEEVGYSKRPFELFCARRAYAGDFGCLLEDVVSRRLERKTTKPSMDEYAFLTTDERVFVEEYFQAAGRGDTQAQKGYFSNAKIKLDSLKTKGEEDGKKYTDLYTKLGFLAGLAMMIILL